MNPSKNPLSFLDKAYDGQGNEIGFSENAIYIEVRGRNLVDLSLIDLPGIISNPGEAEKETSVDLIKDLVRKTISRPNCLILTTITMADDFQNQVGVTFAKAADPKGKRTIGVLTKPDRVDKADLDQWLPIIENKVNTLLYGYYVVKNPSSQELMGGTDWGKARLIEKEFFSSQPWHSFSWNAVARLGSSRLKQSLEILLEKIIHEKLPETVKRIETLHRETKDRLAQLPKAIPENEALGVLHQLCKGFGDKMQLTLAGYKHQALFSQPFRVLLLRFREKV